MFFADVKMRWLSVLVWGKSGPVFMKFDVGWIVVDLKDRLARGERMIDREEMDLYQLETHRCVTSDHEQGE